MKLLQEFKEFAVRGNAIDLAVGIIIGAGFSKIVTSLVEDVIMPPIGLFTGNVDFASKDLVLRAATEVNEAIVINYGTFISTVVEFVIIAFSVFLIIKYINSLKREKEASPEPQARICPFCKEGIASEASRCPHCTAEIS
ncbi:MAG: large-conductance mechanosensitive channel protein MscL [Candidatus Paceibacterota bacterium]